MSQQAGMLGVEVLQEDERHPGIGRQLLEKRCERLEAARRGADADHYARTPTRPGL